MTTEGPSTSNMSSNVKPASLNPMDRDIEELKLRYPGRGEKRHCYDLTSETRLFSNGKTATNKPITIKGLLTGREVSPRTGLLALFQRRVSCADNSAQRLPSRALR